MAAESVGLAASVAGLLSLGLQVTGGLVAYLDALKSRGEELASVRRQNDALVAALAVIRDASSSFKTHRHAAAVMRSIQTCEGELQAAADLLAGLASCDTSTWRKRMSNKKKLLSYLFDRSKVQQVNQRLHHVNGILQLTLTGLGLDASASNMDSLNAIESNSREQGSNLGLLRSEVAAAVTSITDVSRSQEFLRNQFEQHLETLGRIEHLQQATAFALRAASKPAMLRDLCNSAQGSIQTSGRRLLLEPPSQNERNAIGVFQSLQLGSTTGNNCICPQPYRLATKKEVRWGGFNLSRELETRDHWPSCPMSNTNTKTRQAIHFKYTGLISILQAVIDISFAKTSGAGGFILSPSFTYYPTVNEKSDPAFRILHLIRRCYFAATTDTTESFTVACLGHLARLFEEKRACPTAVTQSGSNLMHKAVNSVMLATTGRGWNLRVESLFVGLIKTLLRYGVTAVSYNSEGRSPLLRLRTLRTNRLEQTKDILNVLVQANSESHPAITSSSPYRKELDELYTTSYLALYNVSTGYAEACECGPLSMAVIRNDAKEVARILTRYPGSIAEVDIHGQTPLHLAVAKPPILRMLVKATDSSVLDHVDRAGATALEAAMVLSSNQCVNGARSKRCQRCVCVQGVELLLGAGSQARMHRMPPDESKPGLDLILGRASELARRCYVFHMRQLRDNRPQPWPTTKRLAKCPNSDELGSSGLLGSLTASLPQLLYINPNRTKGCQSENYNWIYEEIDDPALADRFYRHGFRPDASFFDSLPHRTQWVRLDKICQYFFWLAEHGADLFLRTSIQPPQIDLSSSAGIYGAHYAFLKVGKTMLSEFNSRPASFERLSVAVMCRGLSDGCVCHCSRGGCNPFMWMIKGMDAVTGASPQLATRFYKEIMERYYTRCSPELAILTYETAIRYTTFQVLGLVHTCCKPGDMFKGIPGRGIKWTERGDAMIMNEEQSSLIELHEKLVSEFMTVAPMFMQDDLDTYTSFSNFWSRYWKVRMDQELEKLDGDQLTDAERRGAAEIGVQWCEAPEEVRKDGRKRNPYPADSLEHWLFELDLVCPAYNGHGHRV